MDDYELTIEVSTPSGARSYVLNEEEKDYYDAVAKKYQKDNKFTNISDLQDLDRILMMELMVYRWSRWIQTEQDYDGARVDLSEINDNIKKFSGELRLLKASMAMDKVSREKDRGETVAAYLEELRVRAREFGIMRNEQAVKAITLFMDLKAMITMYNNMIPEERKEEHMEMEDIFKWIDEKLIPEFDVVDEEFRKTSQQYWIRNI